MHAMHIPRTSLHGHLLVVFFFALVILGGIPHLAAAAAAAGPVGDSTSRDAGGTCPKLPDPLECFQLASPVLTPSGIRVDDRVMGQGTNQKTPSCYTSFREHKFTDDNPLIDTYAPPPGCRFNRVVMSILVHAVGTQHERLGIMYLGGNEIWRMSTPQPKSGHGIRWTHWKDLSTNLSLFQRKQQFVFDLPSAGDGNPDGGFFKVCIGLTFFQHTLLNQKPNTGPADMIIPMVTVDKAKGIHRAFVYPQDYPELITNVPRHTRRAVFSISATGQGGEALWWQKVPSSISELYSVTHEPLPGLSGYREVRLLIDGQLAGIISPAPLTVTGGMFPAFHRPVAGIQVFDLPQYEIDITPWLELLTYGWNHSFALEVWAIDDRGETPVFVPAPSHWVLTGRLFMWFGNKVYPHSSKTKPQPPMVNVSALDYEASHSLYVPGHEGIVVHNDIPAIPLPSHSPGRNKTLAWGKKKPLAERSRVPAVVTNPDAILAYHLKAKRTLRVKGGVQTEKDGLQTFIWTQELNVRNDGLITAFGYRRKVDASYKLQSRAEVKWDGRYFYHGWHHKPQVEWTWRVPDKARGYDQSVEALFRHKFEETLTGWTTLVKGIEPYTRFHTTWPSGSTTSSMFKSTALMHQQNGNDSNSNSSSNSNGGGGPTRSVGYAKSWHRHMVGTKNWLNDQGIDFEAEKMLFYRDIKTVNETVYDDDCYSMIGDKETEWWHDQLKVGNIRPPADQTFAPVPVLEPKPVGKSGLSEYPEPDGSVESDSLDPKGLVEAFGNGTRTAATVTATAHGAGAGERGKQDGWRRRWI